MNEFNKNKLDQQVLNRQGQYSHRVGPIANPSLPGSTGQQQSYQNLPVHDGTVSQGSA